MRVKCTYNSIIDGSSGIVEGGVYDALYDGVYTYLIDDEGDRLYFDLKTGRCSWINKSLSSRMFSFEEVEKPQYATSPEVLSQVLRKMADNVVNGLCPTDGVQMEGMLKDSYCDIVNGSLFLERSVKYRVKPETITLKNGVEVPKPLRHDDLEIGTLYHFPSLTKLLSDCCYRDWLITNDVKLIYATREDAIEASKALFGLEIKAEKETECNPSKFGLF